LGPVGLPILVTSSAYQLLLFRYYVDCPLKDLYIKKIDLQNRVYIESLIGSLMSKQIITS